METTSSFFWSSPWTLTAPWTPVKFEMLALCTSEAICLHAIEMLESTIVSSASITPACSCFSSQFVNVSIWKVPFFFVSASLAAPTAAHRTVETPTPPCLLFPRHGGWTADERERWNGERRERERETNGEETWQGDGVAVAEAIIDDCSSFYFLFVLLFFWLILFRSFEFWGICEVRNRFAQFGTHFISLFSVIMLPPESNARLIRFGSDFCLGFYWACFKPNNF